MQCESLRIKVSRHLISRDSLSNCVLIETKYSPIIEEIKAQVQMLLFIYPFLVVVLRVVKRRQYDIRPSHANSEHASSLLQTHTYNRYNQLGRTDLNNFINFHSLTASNHLMMNSCIYNAEMHPSQSRKREERRWNTYVPLRLKRGVCSSAVCNIILRIFLAGGDR